MLISLNWIRDYVDLPADLDPRELAERFTRTTAEVDGVRRIEVNVRGLICARITGVTEIPGSGNKRLVALDVGGGRTAETVSVAAELAPGRQVVYAPVGASVAAFGKLAQATVAGKSSAGMILPGEALGIEKSVQEAIFLSSEFNPGDVLPPDLFDDWVIEIDNKSITNRPDLWGHYGIAREIAAIASRGLQPARTSNRADGHGGSQIPPVSPLGKGGGPIHGSRTAGDSARTEVRPALRPYPVVGLDELNPAGAKAIRIHIADAAACPRYSAITLEGVPTQPAPLWIQLRLGHVGQRPISGLVDLTNYIMMDLGQPMHAFDAAKVDSIEVNWAKDGERFKTLDGVERSLIPSDLMIQCRSKSVALAGVMGGLETEVEENTTALLLESANFDPAVVRKTARRLGLRSEASARFEKSLDPAHTVLAIQRFVLLARTIYPDMRLTSVLSDAYPSPRESLTVTVKPGHVARVVGREIPFEQADSLLSPLGFKLTESNGNWLVAVPSFRATGDVSIEADVIEEIARGIGYDTIAPAMPQVTARQFPINALHELEQRTLEYIATAHAFNEIHGYLWYDSRWLSQIGYDPGSCIEVQNPAGEGLNRLRRRLMPGVLAAVATNRFHFSALALIELGSVFTPGEPPTAARAKQALQPSAIGEDPSEFRHAALVLAQRGKSIEQELDLRLRAAIEGWAWERFGRQAQFVEVEADPARPWEQPHRTAEVIINGTAAGRTSLIDQPLRRAMDEHLVPWSICWAELWLSNLTELERATEKLGVIPEFPVVEMDFSIVVPRTTRYAAIASALRSFKHDLLRQVRFVTSYDGKSIDSNKRSLTFRTMVAEPTRTLTDADAEEFRAAFSAHLERSGYEIRKS